MKKTIFVIVCLLSTVMVFSFPQKSQATSVGLELLLLVDVSGSVDSSEYNLQKTGYVNAFNNADIQSAISGISGGIAVAYAEWSGYNQQSLQVDWTHIDSAATSSAFATAISGTTRAFSGSTYPDYAINWGIPLFDNNGFEGTRLVMDISGDGTGNSTSTATAAGNANAAGITVNGLAIGGTSIENWYQTYIVTPGGGTLWTASTFDNFSTAVTAKIGSEIEAVPEPGTILLIGIGLIGLAGVQRKFKKV